VRHKLPLSHALLMSIIGEELHILRTGCFRYFERGGECVDGPVSLLSGSVF